MRVQFYTNHRNNFYNHKTNKMKSKFLLIIITATCLCSCIEKKTTVKNEPPKKTKYIVWIGERTESKTVYVTQVHDNRLRRTAGGAIIGGLTGGLFGVSILKSAGAGAVVGAATSDNPSTESYTEVRTTTHYTIKFNDSSEIYRVDYCPYVVGDSIQF
jgi:uncharacterized protein YcfJ